MAQFMACLLLLILLAGCVGPSNAGQPPKGEDPIEDPIEEPSDPEPEEPEPEEPEDPEDPEYPEPGAVSVTFMPEATSVRNPERGFHTYASLTAPEFRITEPYSLVRSYVRLDQWRTRDLPQSLLDQLDAGFSGARDRGLKVILRFSYNFGPNDGGGLDTSIRWVERHISQLTPVLVENADVIAVLQAGFIGRWGEWHNSTNDLTNDENRERVTRALLAAMPESRMIQLRSPWHMRVTFPETFDPMQAFSGNDQSRVGFKNDCFLAGIDDIGTYDRNNPERDRAYAAALGAFTVVGGETCSNEYDTHNSRERRACDNAIAEMERFGWDYLNLDFYYEVLDSWRAQGCFDEIADRLGYRFELHGVEHEGGLLHPGETLALRLGISNTGFGKLYNPRPLQIVLRQEHSGQVVRMTAVEDARIALPLAGEDTTLPLSVTLPANLEHGSWQVFIALPDASPVLADDHRYSVRLLGLRPDGTSVWTKQHGGLNDLGFRISVSSTD